MGFFEAIFQGILQGVSEFLPISSSGHLSVFQHITGMEESAFTVLLHLGTLFAVILCYRGRIGRLIVEFFRMLGDIFRGRFKWKERSEDRNFVCMVLLSLLPLLLFFFIRKPIQATATDGNLYVEGFSFLATGLLIFAASAEAQRNKHPSEQITWPVALAMGVMQGIAALPGVSRSGSTIAIALLLGLEKSRAVEFSFIMGIPAVLGANLFEMIDLFRGESELSLLPVLVSIAVSAVVGIFAIRLLDRLVKRDRFHIFGYYCTVLGAVCLLLSIAESLAGHSLFI